MKLLCAKIDGFGRYNDQVFTFADGLNVVYGKNEAGKSTLQQFLLAMLYGMKKTGRKRTVYLEEEVKYRPWQGGAYGGVLWLEIDSTEYRIERSLRREDEWVRIFRQDTGEELTARYPVDSRKEVTFAPTLLQADREQFINTLCIGPIDERERVLRLRESVRQGDGGTGDLLSTPEQSQIRMSQEALQKRLEVLGTERAGTKPLGMALKMRDDLQRAYLEAWQREESQKEARSSAEQETVEWQESVRDEQELRDELRNKLARYLRVQQARRGELIGRGDLLRRALAEVRAEEAEEIDDAIFREMQQDLQRLLTHKQEYESYQKRLEVVEAESREAKALSETYENISETFLQEVEHTAYLLELHEKNMQRESPQSFDLEDYEAMEGTRRGQRRKMWLSGGAALLVIPFCFSQWWAIGLFVVFLIIASVSVVSSQRSAEKLERWEEARLDAEAKTATEHAEQERLEARLLKLLSDFLVDTPRQYRQKWSGLVKAREQAAIYQKQTQWLNSEVNRSKSEHDILARRLYRRLFGEEEMAQVDVVQLQEEIERVAHFVDDTHQRKEQTNVWQREHVSLEHELHVLETELTRWQEVAQCLNVLAEAVTLFTEADNGPDVSVTDIERLHQSWQSAERILLERKSTYTEAHTRYQTMREGQQPAADLLLEKERAEAELHQLQMERDALVAAHEIWGEVKDELYQVIAPRFTSSLSAVTERLTQGRYGEIYLDRDEAITTVSPDSGYTVDLRTLSEGTIDQITFALSLALSGWAIPGGAELPLLLDEPFHRYDDDRLDAVLDVLLEEAGQRQIFLFTCREQEVERLMEKHSQKAHVVELSQCTYGMINKEKSSAGQF